ncbi:hypothetical protein HT031_001345 [Scenedesmus sp. PABB004]|nr:hypothetical protein HT031_001345 [Scenedesmus sp. PABB004]
MALRVIAHVDLDAFYTQVEVARDVTLRGKPVVVVQYNPHGPCITTPPDAVRVFPDSNGSIIAVSYEARAAGVKRNMGGRDAKAICPDLQIVQVPVRFGKADLTIYREAGEAVIAILAGRDGVTCERASIDEAYLEVTAAARQLLAGAAAARVAAAAAAAAQGGEAQAAAAAAAEQGGAPLPMPASVEGWHVAGMEPGAAGVAAWWARPAHAWGPDEALLAAGAVVVAELRAAVAARLGFSCSAGLAQTKILSKLGSGLNKPRQQTLVPACGVAGLLHPLPIGKLRNLGGKFGAAVAEGLGVATVGELLAVPLARLEALVGEETAAWVMSLASGQDGQTVKQRTLPMRISTGKTWRVGNALTSFTAVQTWLLELAGELKDRIDADRKANQRLPSQLTVTVETRTSGTVSAASTAAAAAVGEAGGVPVRTTFKNWNDGIVATSRSTPLRLSVDAMAADALLLVKRWARERGSGGQAGTKRPAPAGAAQSPGQRARSGGSGGSSGAGGRSGGQAGLRAFLVPAPPAAGAGAPEQLQEQPQQPQELQEQPQQQPQQLPEQPPGAAQLQSAVPQARPLGDTLGGAADPQADGASQQPSQAVVASLQGWLAQPPSQPPPQPPAEGDEQQAQQAHQAQQASDWQQPLRLADIDPEVLAELPLAMQHEGSMSAFGGPRGAGAKPPEKGIFPLDHFGECKQVADTYLACLKKQARNAAACQELAKAYLECRMQRDLMAPQDLKELGFKDGPRAGGGSGSSGSAAAAGGDAQRAAGTAAMAQGPRGAFILFEGVDRSGKSTQSAKLAAALEAAGVPVAAWNFPDRVNTVTGHAINDYLAGKREQDDAAIHLLFSANRWEKRAALLQALQSGTTLVVDRYAYSGVAYSAAKAAPGMDAAWCAAPDQGLPAPDLVVYLELGAAQAAARAGFGGERYERATFQDRVRAEFEKLKDPAWLVLDAAQPAEAIAARVLAEALDVVKRCQEGQPIQQLWDRRPYQGDAPGGGAPLAGPQ